MTVTVNQQTALDRDVISPVYIVRLDFVDDPIFAWDGPGIYAPVTTGDGAMDGQIFSNLGVIGGVSSFKSMEGISEPVVLSAAGVDNNHPGLRQIIRDKRQWRGKRAYIWFGLLDLTDDRRPVVHAPTRMKSAYMTDIKVNRDDETGVISVTIDEDVNRAKGHIYRYTDQRDYFPTDTAADYIHKLANSPTGIHGPGVASLHAEVSANLQKIIDRF